MATYLDLARLPQTDPTEYGELEEKVKVAVAIKAQAIADSGTGTAGQIAWAKTALRSTSQEARIVINYVLAANNGATTANVLSATDAAIQDNVDSAVDDLLGA